MCRRASAGHEWCGCEGNGAGRTVTAARVTATPSHTAP